MENGLVVELVVHVFEEVLHGSRRLLVVQFHGDVAHGGLDQHRGLSRRQGLAYQAGAEAVFSILIAAGIGYWADQHFGTSPRYLLVGMVLGFSAFVLRLLRLGRQLYRRESNESNQEGIQRKDDT